MRERLIELIQNAVGGCAKHWAEIIADQLLANGVIVPPCKVGDTVYYFGGCGETIIHAKKVKEIRIDKDGFEFVVMGKYMDFCVSQSEAYFTPEEAEQALEKMKGGE